LGVPPGTLNALYYMDSKVAELPVTDKLLAWFESNKRQAGYGAVAIVILGLILGYFFYHKNEQQVAAGEALTSASWNLAATGGAGRPGAADAYLRVASQYPDSIAGARGLLLETGTDHRHDRHRDQVKLPVQKVIYMFFSFLENLDRLKVCAYTENKRACLGIEILVVDTWR